ncbi:MAG: calcium-binding protein [Nitrososphaeraceae archaeon]
MIYYITVVFILTIGLLILMPMYFFEQVGAQLISPNTNASSPPSNTGARVTSSPPSNTGTNVTSSPPSGTLAPSIQLKSSIFEDLAKCISARTCRPTMGSVGDDRIVGGNGSNVIMGLEGNDIIRGGSGDNIIIGGPGDNQLYGGEGNNIILASGTGTNQIYGGSGNNILIAGQGSTLLVAGKGNDKLYGGGGNSVFIGGPGADYFACGSAGPSGGTSKSVVLNFNATKGDDTDGSCGVVLGQ